MGTRVGLKTDLQREHWKEAIFVVCMSNGARYLKDRVENELGAALPNAETDSPVCENSGRVCHSRIEWLSFRVVRVRLLALSWKSDFFGGCGSRSEAGIDVVLEESQLLLPGIQAMGGLGKSVQLIWIGEVEDCFVMCPQSLYELG